MNKKPLIVMLVALLFTVPFVSPGFVGNMFGPAGSTMPATYEMFPFTMECINTIDSSEGDSGWSPLYRQQNDQVIWDQVWSGGFRHTNSRLTTEYGNATQLEGDREDVAEIAPEAFFQYLHISLDPSLCSYVLHLDFWLREDSVSTLSSVDNWAIYIFGTKVSTWSGALWGYSEADCNEHGVFRQQVFDIPLSDPDVYLLIGHGDGWSLDYEQGHTKCFNEVSVTDPVTKEAVLVSEDCTVFESKPSRSDNDGSLHVGKPLIYGYTSVQTYLKFNLYGIRDIRSAKLKLYCWFDMSEDNITCSGSDSSQWNEDNLTWSTRPSASLVYLDESDAVPFDWQEWNVTNWIKTHENTTSVTFVLSSQQNRICADYYSKDDGILLIDRAQWCPRLEIEGNYLKTLVDVVEISRPAMISPYVLYDPPGRDSYQTLTLAEGSAWNMEMGFEFEASVGGGVSIGGDFSAAKEEYGVKAEVDYSQEWGWTFDFAQCFSSSQDSNSTGVNGDTLVGQVQNLTYCMWLYERTGAGWSHHFVGKTELLRSSVLFEKAVVSRAMVTQNPTSVPFTVPSIEDKHRCLSENRTSYYIGPDTPFTHRVSRTYSSGNTVGLKAGLSFTYTHRIPTGIPGVDFFVTFEIKFTYVMKWTATKSTTIETEFVLSDPDGINCHACTDSQIVMRDGVLETQSYLFWFYY